MATMLYPYVRRPSAPPIQPKRVLVTKLGDRWYIGHTPIKDVQQFKQDYAAEIVAEEEKC